LGNNGFLQRKCACGQHTVAGGECESCRQKRLGLQRKLTIGSSNDPLEREADRIAGQVMASPAHPGVSGGPPGIRRSVGQTAEPAGTAPASVERVLAGSGRPLEPALRQDMEGRFGHDFSRVRVHSGAAAQQSARDLDARAFTVGRNVVFGRGEYAPRTATGYRLLAHELTHVIQQSERARNLIQRRSLSDFNDTDPLHDPSRLTDAQIRTTDEYRLFSTFTFPPLVGPYATPQEALLACRLMLRHMREGGAVIPLTDESLARLFIDRARARLETTTTAERSIGTQDWVQASATDVQSPSTAASEFTRWMLAAGNQPDPTTGRLNCWEMVLFSAFRAGHLSEATMRGIYTRSRAAMRGPGGAMAFPQTLERELRSGQEYIYDPANRNTPRPLRGDLVIFREAAAHVALATGRQVGGRIEIVSHWPPPDGDHRVKLTTIEALLPQVGVQVAKFWSPIW
jgi:hypothetical protein